MRIANVSDWRTDPQRSINGAPLDLGEGRTIYVRRAGTRNRDFMAAMVGIDTEDEAALRQIVARTLLASWSGFLDTEGAEVAFSAEECVALFEACPELFDRIWIFASQRANFQTQEVSADAAQLKKRPGGMKAQAHSARN
jgi:hypothetical protein